jgi:serine/threonine protein kinase
MAPEERSRVGELLAGKYRLEKRLGSGGMGDVYRASNVAVGRTVAIKVLRPEHAENEEISKRFLREARAANLVRHDNVVDVLDLGQDESGTPFIVQEFLTGEDLGKHLEDFGGRLPVLRVLEILLPVIDAVGFAHQKGVIHRDLKPDNVFLARERGTIVPKLLDFGISHVISNDPRITGTGVAMGTPAYMPPEQIKGLRSVDARSDVWALGVILYQTIAGIVPFEHEAHSALFVKICTEDAVPLEKLVPTVPADLARIVARCMRRSADERYPSAVELAADIRRVQKGELLEMPVEKGQLTHVVAPGSVPPPRPEGLLQRMAAPTLAAVAANVPSVSEEFAASPELDLRKPVAKPVAPVAAPPPPMPSAPGRDELFEGSFMDNTAGDVELDLASFPSRPLTTSMEGARAASSPVGPSSRRETSPSRRPRLDPQAPTLDIKRLGALGALGLAVIAGLAVLTYVFPSGWPIFKLAAPTYRTIPDGLCGGIGAGLALAGLGLLVRAFQSRPIAWGLAIAAAGVLMLAYFAAAPALGWAEPAGRVPLLAPIAAALVPLGVAMMALQALYEAWARGEDDRRVVGVVVAIVGLFAAVQVGRSASEQPAPVVRQE